MAREKIVFFRASDLEADALKKLAEMHGVSPSELLRNLLRKAAQQVGLIPVLVIEKNESETIAA